MHTVQLKIDDNIYNNVMFLLNNLNLKGLVIEEQKSISDIDDKNDFLDFSNYKVRAFENIKDPLKWQQDIRDEWN